MAIVGLVIGVAVTQLDDYLEINMKKASSKLAATIRYLYNKSATDGIYIRLVMDLDERTYWVEATLDPVKISTAAEDMEVGGEAEKEQKKDESKEAEVPEGTEAAEETSEPAERPKLKYPKPSFGQIDEFLLKPTVLPDSVFFKDVYVEHLPNPVEGGKVAIHFFPNGYVEYAIINLRNEDDDYYYSLTTIPVSGKVAISNEYKSIERK